ncbi:hypothetical protein CLV58_13518 [Spirosoma oryzae]|uniref:Uncharacterized protein n=1 Tax=Spirosoma oryzae TaxID=1469603 RepID=A0A2T0S0R1_9BACT|nr:hypothetical protein [Spirosoma oryzae]PRY27016.1 hypothetical protein CLV58_13518 [Spirosoma oryzae]
MLIGVVKGKFIALSLFDPAGNLLQQLILQAAGSERVEVPVSSGITILKLSASTQQ